MNFIALQSTVRNLIAGHADFAANAATTVFEDVGFSHPLVDAALDISSGANIVPAGSVYTAGDLDISGLLVPGKSYVITWGANEAAFSYGPANGFTEVVSPGAGKNSTFTYPVGSTIAIFAATSQQTQVVTVTVGLAPGAGYAISVWPPTRGHSDTEASGASAVEATIVVRFEINPKMLSALLQSVPPADPAQWVNTRVKDIVQVVLAAAPDAGGVKFQLAPDAFELVNFDEGLLAYHIRFTRLAVFGSGT